MTDTIEPTEEQKQAANAFCVGNLMGYEMQVARLLAEREASHLALIAHGVEVAATLRARVAELERTEAKLTAACQVANATNKRRADREAQHLADIKALVRSCSVAIDAIDDGDTVAARNELSEATERTAHYDVEGEKPRECPEGCTCDALISEVCCRSRRRTADRGEGRCAMSEPTIKPWSYKCYQGCEDVEANHLDGIDPRSRHHHSVEPLYTHDDLVRAVADALREYEVLPDPHRAAVFIVDRLTKGDV